MSQANDLAVVFRAESDIEAAVVKGLLESHGIKVLLSSDAPQSVLPMTANVAGEVRLRVSTAEAKQATQLIQEYRVRESVLSKANNQLITLQHRLGYQFHDQGLLEQALTHRSRVHEDPSGGVRDNESLEFLGDSVLGLVITDRLFRECPDCNEGEKSKARAQLVSSVTLSRLGQQLGLGDCLLLGRGEEKTGGRNKPSLLADGFEAIIAAIYLDGGMVAAEAFIEKCFRSALDEFCRGSVESDFATDNKSALQEWLQADCGAIPEYYLAATKGPDHEKVFTVEVSVDSVVVGIADGHSKKQAEQNAAALALKQVKASSLDP